MKNEWHQKYYELFYRKRPGKRMRLDENAELNPPHEVSHVPKLDLPNVNDQKLLTNDLIGTAKELLAGHKDIFGANKDLLNNVNKEILGSHKDIFGTAKDLLGAQNKELLAVQKDLLNSSRGKGQNQSTKINVRKKISYFKMQSSDLISSVSFCRKISSEKHFY